MTKLKLNTLFLLLLIKIIVSISIFENENYLMLIQFDNYNMAKKKQSALLDCENYYCETTNPLPVITPLVSIDLREVGLMTAAKD